MDNSSVPGASLTPDSTGIITGTHLAILIVLAVLAVIAIIHGARLKRARRHAERELVAHNEAVEQRVDAVEAPVAPVSPPPPPPSPPSAPAAMPLVAEPVAAPPPVATGGGDPAALPVTQLKGLGPKLAAKLAEEGVTTVGQIAALDDVEARALDARLGVFAGRMARDRWIEQARLLAAGDRAGFEAAFGRL